MSFLKKMFGGSSFAEIVAEADQHYDAKKFGEAKLAYDRALRSSKEASEADVARCKERVSACCNAIAEVRMAHAAEHVKHGELDLAREELLGAKETAVSAETIRKAELMLESLERTDARANATEVVNLDDDEQYATIAATWEDEQLDEYDDYGESFRTAMLAMYKEDFKKARAILEGLVREHEKAAYLHYEAGRAQLLDGDTVQGKASLETFLSKIGPDEGGEARRAAHNEIARLYDEAGDMENAIGEFQKAIEALEEDPRPYISLGNYLRTKSLAAEAVQVLEAALDVMNSERRDPFVLQELGLAHAGAGNDDDAMTILDEVITSFSARQNYDFPPEGTVALAALHEKKGNAQRAADLYRSLAQGSDRANHLRYHREAERLLTKLGLHDEAKRMAQRAAELEEMQKAAAPATTPQ